MTVALPVANIDSSQLREASSGYALLPDELRPFRAQHTHFSRIHRAEFWQDGQPRIPPTCAHLDFRRPRIVSRAEASDGSTKLVLQTHDGHRFETVVMPRATRSPRTTLCVSSQVGCAMGCTFCATGSLGLTRNLSAGEIVAQVHEALHATTPLYGNALNLVFMGMGEPLHNFDEVMRAVEVLSTPHGLGIPLRRMTISTSGLVPQIDKLGQHPKRPLLALSLNHTTDVGRNAIMPVGKRYPMAELREALARYPVRPKERITLEYVLLGGENDSLEDAERLVQFARGLPVHINLLPWNEHSAAPHLRSPSEESVQGFRAFIQEAGILVFRRDPRALDVQGACGQLAAATQ